MKKFLVQFLWFSVIVIIGTWLINNYFIPGKIDSITWLTIGYFFVITLIFHFGLLRSSEGKPQAFIRYYMASTTFKLLLHIMVIVIYSLFHKEDAVRFIVTFLVMYILFTGFEVRLVWKEFGGKRD